MTWEAANFEKIMLYFLLFSFSFGDAIVAKFYNFYIQNLVLGPKVPVFLTIYLSIYSILEGNSKKHKFPGLTTKFSKKNYIVKNNVKFHTR